MPIFLFLIVQGYIHTRNFKKYIIRLLFFACITQFALFLCEFIGIEVMQKINTYNICLSFNILFSFVLCLFFLKLLDSVLFEKYFTKDSIKKKVKSDNNIKDKDRNENIKKIKNKKQEFKSGRQKTHLLYNFYAPSDSQTFQKYK